MMPSSKWRPTLTIKQKLDTLGFIPVANTPAEFAERIKSEAVKWDAVIKKAGIHVD